MNAPPEANFGVREIAAVMKGVDFGEWRMCRMAQADTRAWRLAQLATTLMTADVAAGARSFDLNAWFNTAEAVIAEADRRVNMQDGVAS